MPKNKEITTSDFYCTKCGRRGIPIARRVGKQREGGHLKKLYCLFCKEEVNHVEIRPFGNYNYENFKREFELGRFVNGERISGSDLLGCSNHNCKYNVSGQCWNANYSYDCIYRPKEEISNE